MSEMQECRIQLLGRLQFEGSQRIHTRFRTQKTAALLAYLALHPGPQPRELLAELIWPDDAPEAGRHSLRMALSSLRRQLETSDSLGVAGTEELFESSRFAVGLKSGTFSTDVGDFDAALREAHRATTDAERARQYSMAVSLYEGPFLPGFYDDWCLVEATRLQGAFEDALIFLAGWHTARGEGELARDYERRVTALGISLPRPTSAPIETPLSKANPPQNPTTADHQSLEAATNTPSPTPTLATLLAFDGLTLSAKLREALTANGGHRHKIPEKGAAHLWAFSGVTGAFQSATLLRRAESEVLRLALCTGETRLAAQDRVVPLEREVTLRGRVLGMLASAQSGQALCCETSMLLLRDQTEVESLDLGSFHLSGAPAGTASERIFQLTWRGDIAREFAPLRAVKVQKGFIPQPLSRFFGREEELATLHNLLDHERLVTLSGTGGSGKSRLALQFGHTLETSSTKEVFWVPLSDVPHASGIADAILYALRHKRHNALSAFESIVQELNRDSAPTVLLLLDNFEHLVEEGSKVVEDLLKEVPTLQCLVTSRRVLEIQGEVELPLAPLGVPPSSSTPPTPQSLKDQPSVHLFCDRARLVRPDFALTVHNAPAIAELCRHLEGIPLALELAASRAGSLSPARILERLQAHRGDECPPAFERFDFLHAASRTAPSRHRTLRAALDWSFEALEPELQTFFSRLWVFCSGCSIEAAQEIGDTPDALDILEALRVRSLLFMRRNEEPPRFRMLETVRQYAFECAHKRGEVETTCRRHAAYYLKWAQAEATHAIGTDASVRLQSWNRVRAEAGNLRAALAWATQHDPETALLLAMACHNFTGVHLSEREMNVERALQSVEEQRANGQKTISPSLIVGALGLAATHASNRGDIVKQTEFAWRRLELMRDATKPEARAWALFDWGCARRNSGHFAESREALEQSLRIFEKAEGTRRFQLLGWTRLELGLTAFMAGDLETSIRDFEECDEAFAHSGDCDGQASAKSLLADVLFHQGHIARAQQLWPEVLRIERELGDEREHPWRRHQEGKLAVSLGELERGHDLLRRALRSFWLDGHKPGTVRSLLALSSFWLANKRTEQALHLLRVENAERLKAGWPRHEGWHSLRESIWEEACLATSISHTHEDFDEGLPDLATIVENELRGFE